MKRATRLREDVQRRKDHILKRCTKNCQIKCPKCGETKGCTEFYVQKGLVNGLSCWCISCYDYYRSFVKEDTDDINKEKDVLDQILGSEGSRISRGMYELYCDDELNYRFDKRLGLSQKVVDKWGANRRSKH